MFQINEIKIAHLKVRTGADFPKYIQELIALGVKKYETFVHDGHTSFFGEDDYQIESEPKYSVLNIMDESDSDKFKHFLLIHQQGQTNYLMFCKHSAETGVEKWIVDMDKMTCTYYNKAGDNMLEEKIPTL